MPYVSRALEPELRRQLARGKSALLLGARQTGKTTLLARFPAHLRVALELPGVRQRYERNPEQLLGEISALRGRSGRRRRPLVVLDEVQRVCRAPRRVKLSARVTALPWQEIAAILE